ncbi:MAG TPA: hypothetical protein VFX92_09980 [Candidatus Krumholzibacteria bacterium]|nr:hypothetical protein [Candidatus Krumholzibacteria bacterium]
MSAPAARLALALAACACVCAGATPAAAGRWIGAAELGFDSYTERYSISEADTLSSINEARARLRLGYAAGSIGRNYALFEARQYFGASSQETAAHTLITQRLGRTARVVTHIDGEIARHSYRHNSTYEFPNDYTRAYARVGVRARTGSLVTLRLDDRVEYLDYQRRTEFDYDYTRNVATGVVDIARDPLRSVSGGVRFATMSIPDSSEIEYHSLGPILEFRAFGAPRERVYVTLAADRRTYPDDGTRSSFWAVTGSGLLEVPVARQWSIEMAGDVDDYRYDTVTGAYNDYLESRAYVTGNWFSGTTRMGAGPAFGWLTSHDAPQDEYRELGVRVALEHIGSGGLYVSASYEPGLRDYSLYSDAGSVVDNANVIFSDYTYHRVDLFLNARVHGPVWLSAFLDYQPEDHDRDGDDATATVGSFSITYSF